MHGWFDSGVQVVVALVAVAALIVSVIAVIPAFIGLRKASRANTIATGANVIAGEANGIAATAHELSRRQEARATEQYDVEWTVGWIDEHHLFIANQGLDPAHNVRFRLSTPGSIGRSIGPDIVKPWDDFTVPSDVAMPESKLRGTTILLRIVWTSPAGTPHRATVTLRGDDVFRHRRAVG